MKFKAYKNDTCQLNPYGVGELTIYIRKEMSMFVMVIFNK